MTTLHGADLGATGTTPTDLLRDRYGTDLPTDTLPDAQWTAVLRQQLAHRSVREFTDEGVSDAELSAVFAAAQSAPTSTNLQPWSVVVVRDRDRKARLAELAGQQEFIAAAPVFTVWVVDLARVEQLADTRGQRLGASDYLESGLIGFIDAALAAQNASLAAESLGLGTVFVGAVRNRPEELAAELELPERSFPAFGLAIGRPAPGAQVKPRLPQRAVVHHETYAAHTQLPAVEAYEQTIGSFYAAQGLQHSWTARVLARLADAASLKGRHRLREALRARGLPMN